MQITCGPLKVFRVVQDRERWFQIVMGQKFDFDGAKSDALANRMPLPTDLANKLVFDLRRLRPPSSPVPSNQIGAEIGRHG